MYCKYTVLRPLGRDVLFVFFLKFRIPIGLHSSCCSSQTASGTFQKASQNITTDQMPHSVGDMHVSHANRDNVVHAQVQKCPRTQISHLSRSPKFIMKSLLILSALISLSAASITVGKCPVYGANNPDFDPALVKILLKS